MTTTLDPDTGLSSEELVDRLFNAGLGAFELLAMQLGHRLGLYEALADRGPTSPRQLAEMTGITTRYAREWLEQQAVAGFVHVAAPTAEPDERTYRLPDAYVEVLVNPESLTYGIPFGDFVVCAAKPFDQLVEAYRTGGGVHHSHYDPEHRHGQGAFNRPAFLQLLASEWLPKGLPDVHRRLLAEPGARVADLGCGLGWACIGLARNYPKVQVDGFDIDAPSIAEARQHAEEAGVADRVTFGVHDAADTSLDGAYDLVCMFEVLHDVARPVELLRTVRRLLAPGGTALVVDERVAEQFAAPGDTVERFMYTCSVLHCLPIALVEQPSAATGTVMRPDTVRRYAINAGFADAEILPIDNDFFRFYRLRFASTENAR